MNPLTQLKKSTLIFLSVTFICFGSLPELLAVSPPPDGGYPGGNTAEGQDALFSLLTGDFNTAVGFLTLRVNGTGSFNTAIGAGALLFNTADQNTATGATALLKNTSGSDNTADGVSALLNNTTGGADTAIGQEALVNNTTGGDNTAVGFRALLNNTTGSGNIALGVFGGISVTTANGVICIGADGANVDSTCFIGNIHGVTTQINDAIPVLVDSAGQLGTTSSSRRYKTDIKRIDKASESILALKPVSFHYKLHKDMKPQFGLIAEEVAEVNPDLVIYDADRKPYTVRYDAVNAMLLNEFLKEHHTVQEQEKTIAELKFGMTALAATVKEQAAQIQKVSAQLELNKAAPQTVKNDQ